MRGSSTPARNLIPSVLLPFALGLRSSAVLLLPLGLWLMIWTWEADGRTLSVEGKHYGVDKVKEQAKSHEYVFTLKETAQD